MASLVTNIQEMTKSFRHGLYHKKSETLMMDLNYNEAGLLFVIFSVY